MHSRAKTPAVSTTKLYQLLTYEGDDDIHLINSETAKNKAFFKQMVSTSVRNLASHIAAVAYSNFRPIPEKWNAPKIFPKAVCYY